MSQQRRAPAPLDLRRRRVLVTGSAGFLGANLCRTLLDAGASVHSAVRPASDLFRFEEIRHEVEFHAFDLRDAEAVRREVTSAQAEIVIHAAAHTTVHYDATVAAAADDSMIGTVHLLDALAVIGCDRLVHLGSSLEYGPAIRPHREDDALRPDTLRGATKAAATLLVLQQASRGAVAGVVLRPFSIYGPWEGEHRLIPRAIRAAFSGETLPLTGPGLRRDLVYVEDVCDACLRAALADAVVGEVINVGTGRQTSNEEVVEAVERATGRPVRVAPGAFPARSSDRGFWTADTGKAERLLGWTAKHPLAGGLERTVRWFESHQRPERAPGATC